MSNGEQQRLPFIQEEEPPEPLYPAAFLQSAGTAPKLVSVKIDGLKGFDSVFIELPRLAMLTGPNNSGKSTVLQAIALGYECLRRCTDTARWRLSSSGRSVTSFDFLPVNEPRDLWYRQVWKISRETERYVRVSLTFDQGQVLAFRIRFLFGLLNIGLDSSEGNISDEFLKSVLKSMPVLLPATPGPIAHEDYLTLASVHRMLSMREPSRVVRNILTRIQTDGDREAWAFVDIVMKQYFGVSLAEINFDEKRDLEIRAPLAEEDFSVDIVSSGSGMNQILQLATIIAWTKPSVVLLDEPDAHLHSSVQLQLFNFLSTLVERYGVQIILSTHSRDLISQAPLQSIIPVDKTRQELRPLQSIEHLLLEYQRYGSVTNVDLALLYQTKRCLFVEGGTDISLLPRIADRLGVTLFSGRHQAVIFDFRGVDKLKMLPDLVGLFSRLVGGALTWAVLKDRDATLPEVAERITTAGNALGSHMFHQWTQYSIENLLLDETLIQLAIQRRTDSPFDVANLRTILDEILATVEDEVAGTFVTKAQQAYRDFEIDDRPYEAGAAAATRYLRSLQDRTQKLSVYPGKRIFGLMVQKLQEQHRITLRITDLVDVITRDNCPKELADFLGRLQEKFK
ncbi:MAG TPA: ATP-binding protein [Deltaproteobacteria bacterium]|nr:ATP-binding protein [Deltaproteobacteria bacterium]HXK47168.1 ATP-binding protein [Deltaproteobacteria bacterium]